MTAISKGVNDTWKYFARTEKHDRTVTAQKTAMGTNGLGTITSRSLSHPQEETRGQAEERQGDHPPLQPGGRLWGMCAMLNRDPSIASFPNTPYRCGTEPRVHMVKTAPQSHHRENMRPGGRMRRSTPRAESPTGAWGERAGASPENTRRAGIRPASRPVF